jgi:7,8-dihydro-6-hydroxymethylpterin dimethyltransferase
MSYLTTEEIDAFKPDLLPNRGVSPIERARRVIEQAGFWSANQQMGRRWPIGCVALEITQRCNLDCTLCYLSENSEAVKDLPLEEVFRRIELIRRYYGKNTDVQITGGDPTLRKRDELLAIVRRVRALGMRPTLMTNGIRATRALLEALAESGLEDVAYHVDTTQVRSGYSSEVELNALRQEYIDRVKGLPISVMFNTSVHQGNFDEIPDLVRFFKAKAGVVRTAAFQLQADTGRGVLRKRDTSISLETVSRQIERGAGTAINFAGSLVGHPACNRYGMCLMANGRLYDAFEDVAFIGRMLCATAALELSRNNARTVANRFLCWLVAHPGHMAAGLVWVGKKAWQMKRDLIAAHGRVQTLSFVIHNFMGSCALERDRVEACVFKTMTRDGPISMCVHNAKRDRFILQPIQLCTEAGESYWQPLTGSLSMSSETPLDVDPQRHGLKHAKGRTRQTILKRRII